MLSAESAERRTWRSAGVVPVVLDILILLALFAAPLSWLLDPWRFEVGPWRVSISWGFRPVLVPIVLFIVRCVIVRGSTGLLSRSLVKRLIIAVYPAWVMLLLAEGVLALVGFSRLLPPVKIEGDSGSRAQKHSASFDYDAELGWVFRLEDDFRGQPVNQLGFLDREVTERKMAGTKRVICMGDSCTAQGNPPYSGYLHQLLTEDPVTPENWEAFNVGIHGYSSWQGLKLYRRRIRGMQADVITLYFGWNDHWSAREPDAVQYGHVFSPCVGKLLNALHRKRFYAFLVYALRGGFQAGEEERMQMRVPPEEYVRNLQKLVDEIRADDAIPILITAPRAERLASLIVRRYCNLSDMEEALEIHDRYVEMTRRVAAEKNVELLDLAALFVGPEAAPMFLGDGIHFRQRGLEPIASEIHAHLKKMAARGDL